jgi:hypothetical protein
VWEWICRGDVLTAVLREVAQINASFDADVVCRLPNLS